MTAVVSGSIGLAVAACLALSLVFACLPVSPSGIGSGKDQSSSDRS